MLYVRGFMIALTIVSNAFFFIISLNRLKKCSLPVYTNTTTQHEYNEPCRRLGCAQLEMGLRIMNSLGRVIL